MIWSSGINIIIRCVSPGLGSFLSDSDIPGHFTKVNVDTDRYFLAVSWREWELPPPFAQILTDAEQGADDQAAAAVE